MSETVRPGNGVTVAVVGVCNKVKAVSGQVMWGNVEWARVNSGNVTVVRLAVVRGVNNPEQE